MDDRREHVDPRQSQVEQRQPHGDLARPRPPYLSAYFRPRSSRAPATAARAIGASPLRVIIRHVLPNTASFVIVTATLNAADLIDMSDSLGTIEPGKFADIIAVDDSPLENIEELLDVDFVMKGGRIFRR